MRAVADLIRARHTSTVKASSGATLSHFRLQAIPKAASRRVQGDAGQSVERTHWRADQLGAAWAKGSLTAWGPRDDVETDNILGSGRRGRLRMLSDVRDVPCVILITDCLAELGLS